MKFRLKISNSNLRTDILKAEGKGYLKIEYLHVWLNLQKKRKEKNVENVDFSNFKFEIIQKVYIKKLCNIFG